MVECVTLKITLNLYEHAFGQAINYDNSGIYFTSNVALGVHDELRDTLGIFNPLNTGKYLGIPSLTGRGKFRFFYILGTAFGRLQHWQRKKIYKAGKEVLLKSAAQDIATYRMSMFLLPSTLLDEFHRMMNSFWWRHGMDPKKVFKWEM